MTKTKRITLLALFVSLAMILSVVEAWIPLPIAIPGVKLGLANIVTVLVIISFGYKDAFTVVIIRCLLVSMLFGGPIIFLFSITGGLLSTLVMSLMFKYFKNFFSILGISIAGSIAHNVGQIIIACIILREILIVTYLPILLVAGVITGVLVGILSKLLSDSMQKIRILNIETNKNFYK